MKYLHKISEIQLFSILPYDNELFELLHFEKMSDGTYLIHYSGPRALTLAKGNELEELLEETKEI